MKRPSLETCAVIGFALIPIVVASGLFSLRLASGADASTSQLLPDTTGLINACLHLAGSTAFLSALAHTTKTVLLATLCALGCGSILGGLLAYNERIWRLAAPTIDFIRSIPVTFFVAPLALLWGSKSPALVVTLAAIPSTLFLLLGIRQGITHHDPERIRAFDLYLGRSSRASRFVHVLVPETAPDIFHGLRIGVSYALVIVTVLEYFEIGRNAGLGALLRQNQDIYNTAGVLALIISVGFLGFLLNKLLEWIQHWLFPASQNPPLP